MPHSRNFLLTRRQFIQSSAVAAAGLGLAPLWANPARANTLMDLPLITKPVPSSGEQLPVIGIGTNAFSVDSPGDMAPLRDVLEMLPQLGGTVIDTARVYGRSEEVIGELVEQLGNRDQLFIASKTPISGALGDPEEELLTSFRRLRVEKLDLMLIHNLHGLDALMPTYMRFRDQGHLRYIGMSTSTDTQYVDQMAAMRRYPLDFIQVDYSIDNRNSADEILPLAQELGIAVMINVPFGGRRNAGSIFARLADIPLPDWAADFDATSWAQVLLKYVVSHPAVNVAIPGTTNTRHLIDNQGAARGRLPDADMRRRIEVFWDNLPA
jgi:diketogulonate reductase-like aldo/keto reductase